MKAVLELKEKRGKNYEALKALLAKAKSENRGLNAEEQSSFDKIHAEDEELRQQINNLETAAKIEADLTESNLEARDRRGGRRSGGDVSVEERQKLEERAFDSYCRYGIEGLHPEEREVLGVLSPLEIRTLAPELRAQGTGTLGAGGALIPKGFSGGLDEAMLAFGGMRRVSDLIRTASGNPFPYPTTDDTSNEGVLLAENTAAAEQDVEFGEVEINAFKYSSKLVRVSAELLQDSAFDFGPMLQRKLGERLSRITNRHATVGTGSGQPNGIVTAATDSGVTFDISSGQTYDNWVDLEHAVDASYRLGASFMCHDDLYRDAKKIVDLNGRPIFRPADAAPGSFDTILNYPLEINQHMPDPGTATNKAAVFGNLKKYLFRVVRPMVLLRLVERYAEYHQVGFIAFERMDGDLIDAGTHPVKYAAMVA